jgi:hypothetical protein
MGRIKIKDLPEDHKISKEDLKRSLERLVNRFITGAYYGKNQVRGFVGRPNN